MVAIVSLEFGRVYVFSDDAGPVNCMKALFVPPFAPDSGDVPGLVCAMTGVQKRPSASVMTLRSFMSMFQRC